MIMRPFFLMILCFATACATPAPAGGTYVAPAGGTDSGAGTTADSGTGAVSDTASVGPSKGDDTKNTAAIESKGETGTATQVKANKPATAADTKNRMLGGANAGKILSLFVSDGTSVLVVTVDTDKVDVPGTFPVGGPNSEAWVSLTQAAPIPGVYNSKDKGTITLSNCPEKPGVAIVGSLNDVVVYNDAPIAGADKQKTLKGPFNLVYQGGASALTCRVPFTQPVDAGGTAKDAGSTGGGKLSMFKKPAGSTCSSEACDGGANVTRNCCKYGECLSVCFGSCAEEIVACAMGCGADATCGAGCSAKTYTCFDSCPEKCKVDAGCKAGLTTLNKCLKDKCPEDSDACAYAKCCGEIKGAW
ncbi:MAG: hypothetical protein EXR79_13695 [Myxococcales bacterium]|nr:hypothetical protein [Myxococcales bacterium]